MFERQEEVRLPVGQRQDHDFVQPVDFCQQQVVDGIERVDTALFCDFRNAAL
jgi:hypothetical protein